MTNIHLDTELSTNVEMSNGVAVSIAVSELDVDAVGPGFKWAKYHFFISQLEIDVVPGI